jgi:WD40 repeat protein
MEGHKGLVSALLVDRELLYSGSWDGTIHVWWRSDQSLVAVLDGGESSNPSLGGVRALCMSDSFLFAGRDSGAIQVGDQSQTIRKCVIWEAESQRR